MYRPADETLLLLESHNCYCCSILNMAGNMAAEAVTCVLILPNPGKHGLVYTWYIMDHSAGKFNVDLVSSLPISMFI